MLNLIKTKLRDRRGEASQKNLYAVAFGLIAVVAVVIVALVLKGSQADDSTQTTTVTNAQPTLSSLTISTSSLGSTAISGGAISPTADTTKDLYVWATATDSNGYDQINATTNYNIRLYKTSTGISCSANKNNCYIADTSLSDPSAATADDGAAGGVDLSSCTSGTTCVAQGKFTGSTYGLQYYADATDGTSDYSGTNWTASMIVTDDQSSASATASTTFEMTTVTSLDVTSSIAYGTLGLGDTSSEQTVVITNKGNAVIDSYIQTSGAMTCTTGGSSNGTSIGVGQAKWSGTSGFTYASQGTALDTNYTLYNDWNVPVNVNGTAGTVSKYFKLQLPSTGVSGTCTNTITFTAFDS